MPYYQDSPLATGLGFASSYLQGQQERQKTQREFELAQAKQDQDAQYQAASIALSQAQGDRDQGRFGMEQTRAGIGATGPGEMPKNKDGSKPTLRQQADFYANAAGTYLQQGATDIAKQYSELASSAQQQADAAERAEIAMRKQLADEIKVQAQINHWTAQEKQAAQNGVNQVLIAGRHDLTALQSAGIHANAIINAANTQASARIQAAGISSAGAMDRTQYTQGAEDRRQQRGFVQQTKIQGMPSRSTGANGVKFKSIPLEQQMGMASAAKGAIAQGVPKAAVLQHMASGHGIPIEQAQAIYEENGGDE